MKNEKNAQTDNPEILPDKLVSISKLKPFANNARTHSDAQIAQLMKSIEHYGWTQPVLIDELNTIIAGHGRVLAAKKMGIKKVPCKVAPPWDDETKRAYVLADNALAEQAGWDKDLLKLELGTLMDAGFDLELTGFTLGDIKGLDIGTGEGGLTDDDAVPAVAKEAVTREGDIWLLGQHRLMCGDSKDAGSVALLMAKQKADMIFTDPPYGVEVIGGRTKTVKDKDIKPIENDDLEGGDLVTFLCNTLNHDVVKKGAAFYVCYDHKTQGEFSEAIAAMDWNRLDTIIWRKNVFGLSGRKGYRPQFEMIAFGVLGSKNTWYGDNAQSNVWDFNRPTERPGNHPTPKPVELIEKALGNSSKQDDIVLDYFGGVGSTLIACQKTKRRCHMIELEALYVDTIVKRWQEYTGEVATLEENGKPFEEIKAERGK